MIGAVIVCACAACERSNEQSAAKTSGVPTTQNAPAAPAAPAPDAAALAAANAEREKIEKLLRALCASDAVFIRNDVEHKGPEGEAHLRRKWNNAGARIATAREFVEHIASVSSQSGREYTVRTADGNVMPSRKWFENELAAIEADGGGR